MGNFPHFTTVNSIAEFQTLIENYKATVLNYFINFVFFKEQNLNLENIALIPWMMIMMSVQSNHRTSNICS